MRHGVRYLRRRSHEGAKAGNINHALGRTDAPFVLVLDCDHVPYPNMLERLLPELIDPRVAYVQSPQYYANHDVNRLAGAAWSQQALFFGPIARGKDSHRSMICCGTNVVFRRDALDDVGGFPQGSLTEDFALSIDLHVAALGVGVRLRGAGRRLRARGPRRLRRPAAPLGPGLPRDDPEGPHGRAAAAQEGAVPAVRVVLPVRLDGGLLPDAAARADPVRRATARRRSGRHLPRRLRPVLRCCRWRRWPASAPAPTRSPPTRWRRRRSGCTSTPRSWCCSGAPAGSSSPRRRATPGVSCGRRHRRCA